MHLVPGKTPTPANRLGLDYRQEAKRLGPPPSKIVDAHTHIAGVKACKLYDEARRCYGVRQTYSMTQLNHAPVVRDVLGDSIRFIAVPQWYDADKAAVHRGGFLRNIEEYHRKFNSRMLKLWSSPRLRDLGGGGAGNDATDLADLDSPWRIKACELGQSLGMMFMTHVADPDTWFAAKYTDAKRYGTKRDQYAPLERMLDRFAGPWVAAHMGGWPEDLAFLDGLLTRHSNLSLDTSATKWMVRELSRQPRNAAVAFFTKWGGAGRLLFGSDIVVMEDQLSVRKSGVGPMSDLADSPEAAFDLYASRYWALRILFETDYDGESPIADPDLKMVEPGKHDDMSAPRLRGLALPREVLATMYSGAATALLDQWWRDHP